MNAKAGLVFLLLCGFLICVLQNGWNIHLVSKSQTARTKLLTTGSTVVHRISHTYSEQPYSCLLAGNIPEMVLFISSRPKSMDMRTSIRETWGSTAASCGVRVIFGFGKQYHKALQKAVSVENLLHGDILQIETVDDGYRNQTSLVLAFFAWAEKNCEARFVAKGDDDTWLNFLRIMPLLRSIRFERFVAGPIFHSGNMVIRDNRSVQHVTKEERFDDRYPSYMSGILYVFAAGMISELLRTANRMKSYWIDDTFITGEYIKQAP